MPSRQLFVNNAKATLASGISSGATSVTVNVGEGARFLPSPAAGEYYRATLRNNAGSVIELVDITAVVGDVLTISRAKESTTAQAFSAGDTISIRATKDTLTRMAQKDANETVTGTWTFTGLSLSSLTLGGAAYTRIPSEIGQCRLVYVSATQLRLDPFNGNQIFINGSLRTIPSPSTITLSNATMAASTLYYIYAYWNGSAVTLEFSATAPATDATYGHQIKTGDATRTLVGLIYTNASTQFDDSATKRNVATYFNRAARTLYYLSAAQVIIGSTPWVQLGSAFVEAVAFADQVAQINGVMSGYKSNGSGGVPPAGDLTGSLGIFLDGGGTFAPVTAHHESTTGLYYEHYSTSTALTFAAGRHTFSLVTGISAGGIALTVPSGYYHISGTIK